MARTNSVFAGLINLWKWTGEEFDINDDNEELPEELAKSSVEIEEKYDEHFKKNAGKVNSGKFKVEENELKKASEAKKESKKEKSIEKDGQER